MGSSSYGAAPVQNRLSHPCAIPIASPDTSPKHEATWKVILALLSLSLSLLLWTNSLLSSLQRPSVTASLDRRQLELGVVAAPALKGPLRSALISEDPEARLLEALLEQGEDSLTPRERLLAQLLARRAGNADAAGLPTLPLQADGAVGRLARSLDHSGSMRNMSDTGATRRFPEDPLLERLGCEALGGPPGECLQERDARQAALRLAVVSVLPIVLLIAGVALLIRLIWRLWQHSLPPQPVVLAPPLSLVDVTLLITGGFVVMGETLVPLIAVPLVQALTGATGLTPPRSDALSFVLVYLSLMALPLVMLQLMLRGQPEGRECGLQWRWIPLGSALRQGLGGVLMVLPAVSLAGWVAQHWMGEGGGSNPLLEVVMGSRDSIALFCLAFTALVLAPWFEELLFRGVLLPVMVRQESRMIGLVVSALVFAAAHLSAGELFPLLVLGIGLGWLRLTSGRLAPCVLMHALWNGFTFINLIALGG